MSTAPGIKTAAAALEALLDLPQGVEGLRQEIAALRAEVRDLRKMMPPTLVTMSEAGRVLKVSLSTVKRQVKAGSLRAVRIGEQIRVDLSDIQGALSR